jgi:hypothetical protein
LSSPARRAHKGCARGVLALIVLFSFAALLFGVGRDFRQLPWQNRALSSSLLRPAPNSPRSVQIPLYFEPNVGQSPSEVEFVGRGTTGRFFLTADSVVFPAPKNASALRMRFAGNRSPNPALPLDKFKGRSNYFVGNDPSKWHTGIAQFGRVRYRAINPGVDLAFYGTQGQLEYDFEVAPGADPSGIDLAFEGARDLKLDAAGDLILQTSAGVFKLHAPHAYQRNSGDQKQVASRYVLRADSSVGFEIGSYDRNRELVIDPVLSFSTFLGGSLDERCSVLAGGGNTIPGCPSVVVDAALNMYIAGSTASSDFPGTTGFAGIADVFVTKLDSSGATVFATLLGGNGIDYPTGLAVDTSSNVVVGGATTSIDFPTKNAFQSTPASTNNKHAFLAQLDPTGVNLKYSTYLSGTGNDIASGVAVDVPGKAYVFGISNSTDFPTTPGAFQPAPAAAGVGQFFLSKIDPTLTDGSSLVYSTYIGGTDGAFVEGGQIAVDTNPTAPSVYLSGTTDSTTMPVLNAAQGTNAGAKDAWLAKFTPTNVGSAQEIYLSYFGGSADDFGNAVSVDASGQAYLTGSTASSGLPAAAGATPFQANIGGGTDAYVVKIGSSIPSGKTAYPINYFSYLGGSGNDAGLAIVAESSSQAARIVGWTQSANFPVPGTPFQSGPQGGVDTFVSRIVTTTATTGNEGTYLGGGDDDFGTSVATDGQGNVYVAGETQSSNFPHTSGSFTLPSDDFITRFGPTVNLAVSVTATPNPVGMGNVATYTYTITNNGELTGGIIFTDNVAGSSIPVTAGTLTASPGSCSVAVNGSAQCNLGTLAPGATAKVTVPLTPTPPTTPNTAPATLINSGTVSVTGSSFTKSASANVTVNDFNIKVDPPTATVTAGQPATYTVTVTPTGSGFSNSVSLSASSGLPTGASATFPQGASITNLSSGAQSRQLVINTTARVTTPASLFRPNGPMYAAWLPLSGLAMIGAGVGRRKHRGAALGLFIAALFSLLVFQAACGTSSSSSTTTGTPAGTYSVTVTATSGAARTQEITLTVN